MKATEYKLTNVADGFSFEDAGWSLAYPKSQTPSLVRADYECKEFTPDAQEEGLYRYHNWMPVKRALKGSCAPVTYKSKALAERLGLRNLYITISGWFPQVGARFKTASFKETEAYSVCGRLDPEEKRVLVVASAGNTARAFASVCSKNNIPIVICIPADNMSAMWFDAPLNPCVKIICSPCGSDYFDAIALGDKLCTDSMFFAEGGAKNVARRDGMGTTYLSAIETIGSIPDAYFQAIGSGTGAIAAWENNLRIISDGRFGNKKTRIMASQNVPFTIMADTWALRQRNLVDMSAQQARESSAIIKAKVLSNRKPPFSLAGGVFDCLTDTKGEIYSIDNSELESWSAEFETLEGVDINPAAAVAVASLSKAVERKDVGCDDIIMLNITGAGENRLKAEIGENLFMASPALVIDNDADASEVVEKVKNLFK